MSSRLYTRRKLRDGRKRPSLLRLSRVTGSRRVAGLPPAAPSFRPTGDSYRRVGTLSGCATKLGAAGAIAPRRLPTGNASASADRLGPPCAKTGNSSDSVQAAYPPLGMGTPLNRLPGSELAPSGGDCRRKTGLNGFQRKAGDCPAFVRRCAIWVPLTYMSGALYFPPVPTTRTQQPGEKKRYGNDAHRRRGHVRQADPRRIGVNPHPAVHRNAPGW